MNAVQLHKCKENNSQSIDKVLVYVLNNDKQMDIFATVQPRFSHRRRAVITNTPRKRKHFKRGCPGDLCTAFFSRFFFFLSAILRDPSDLGVVFDGDITWKHCRSRTRRSEQNQFSFVRCELLVGYLTCTRHRAKSHRACDAPGRRPSVGDLVDFRQIHKKPGPKPSVVSFDSKITTLRY